MPVDRGSGGGAALAAEDARLGRTAGPGPEQGRTWRGAGDGPGETCARRAPSSTSDRLVAVIARPGCAVALAPRDPYRLRVGRWRIRDRSRLVRAILLRCRD